MSEKTGALKRNTEKESMEILRRISEKGGMCCTGSCHHQKPSQYHCRQIGKEMELGHSTVWERVNSLLNQGLLERIRKENQPVYFVITGKGKEKLNSLL